MKAISLFSGIGGMDIGFSAAGFNIVAQVEIGSYCRRVLKRHAPEWWRNATQFTDVCQFGRDSIKGEIDVIFGGFPCQPHSVAGKRKGKMDSRNLWPEFRRIISELQPLAVLLENVPGILSTGYAPTIIADLAEMGYLGRAGIISAQNAGAPHRRERWWCVAYTESQRCREKREYCNRQKERIAIDGKILADPQHNGHVAAPQQRGDETPIYNGKEGQNSTGKLARKCSRRVTSEGAVEHSPATRLQRHNSTPKRNKARHNARRFNAKQHIRPAKPRLGRTASRIPHWLDTPQWPAGQGTTQYDYEAPRTVQTKTAHDTSRIKALGNAVVPQIVYALAKEISQNLSQ